MKTNVEKIIFYKDKDNSKKALIISDDNSYITRNLQEMTKISKKLMKNENVSSIDALTNIGKVEFMNYNKYTNYYNDNIKKEFDDIMTDTKNTFDLYYHNFNRLCKNNIISEGNESKINKICSYLEQSIISKNLGDISFFTKELDFYINKYLMIENQNAMNKEKEQEDLDKLKKDVTNLIETAKFNKVNYKENEVLTLRESKKYNELISNLKVYLSDNDYKKTYKNGIKLEKRIRKYDNREQLIKKGKFIRYSKLKRAWFISKIVIAGAVLGFLSYIGKDIYDRVADYFKNEEKNIETEIDIPEYTFTELLDNNNINESRKSLFRNVWKYLNNYNRVFYLNDNKKFEDKNSLNCSEVISEMLVYNTYSEEEIMNIFGTKKIELDDILNSYKNSIKKEQHINKVLIHSIEKDLLINNSTHKSFYKKYEDLMIRYNLQKTKKQKNKIKKEFYKNVKKDFKLGDKVSFVDSYKLSVIPIINTFTKNDNKFNKRYRKYFNNTLINTVVKKKLEKIDNILNDYRSRNATKKDDVGTFEDFEDALIKKAKEQKISIDNNYDYNINKNKVYKKM